MAGKLTGSQSSFTPSNGFMRAMLTDLYQVTMSYAYWKNKKHEQHAVYDLFFRKCPFKGEFTIFAGLEECLRFIQSFHFTDEDIEYLKTVLGEHCDPEFFVWLRAADTSQIKVYAMKEGTVCFPRVPLIRVEGPIAICQLLETPLLNCVNYPSLVATNAARHRVIAGPDKTLVEFGLRRAQGPDGGMSASRYSVLGGFDGTSNVHAGLSFGIKISGTHAHAYVSSFVDGEALDDPTMVAADGSVCDDFLALAQQCREEIGFANGASDSELLAFTAFAKAFPHSCLCLVDTYDTLNSGIPNFLAVAVALHRLGYKATGIRLDSGDLAYLSVQGRRMFEKVGEKVGVDYFKNFKIVASNDLNVDTIESLNQQGHSIDVFGVGTNLVTCQQQPALGCVYKLVQINSIPRIKLSQEIVKVTLPGRKVAYRLTSNNATGSPTLDLLVPVDEHGVESYEGDSDGLGPKVGERILCRNPFDEHKRAYLTPTKVERLHELVFENGETVCELPSLEEIKVYVREQLKMMRPDHLRILNPTPYKVSVTPNLYAKLHKLWQIEAPIPEL